MKEIELTQDQVALVDDCDYEWLIQWKWFADKGRKTFYAGRNSPTVNGKRHKIYMHHEIFGKPPKDLVTDHRDVNGLNNQKENLRFVTNRQNCQNRKKAKSVSKYPGIYWQKSIKRWIPRIVINGIQIYLGCFIDEKKAFEIYEKEVNMLGETVISRY